MRLAVLTDRPHSTYGAELNLLALGGLAADAGHDVVAVTIGPGVFEEAARSRGIETLLVPTPPSLAAIGEGGLRATPRTLTAMVRFGYTLHGRMRDEGVEVVISSSVRGAVMLWPGRVRRPLGVWYIQMLNEPSSTGAAATLAANRVAIIAPGVERSIPAPLRRLRRRRIHDLPPCRDVASFANATPHPSPPGELRVVTVCKVTPRKGLTVLIDAVGRARATGIDVSLTVVGAPAGSDDEAYAAAARSQADEIGAPVHWAGWHDDVAPFLAKADVFALASMREGLPGAVIEAMAAGLPAVVTDTGPVADLVEGGRCGLVAPAGDVAALAAHLESLARDADERLEMGRRAARAAGRFSPEATTRAIDDLLRAMSVEA